MVFKLSAALAFSGLMLLSCNKKDTAINTVNLTGTWQEQETAGSFSGTTYRVTFTADGRFSAVLTNYSDAIDTSAACYKEPVSYVSGHYATHDNTISFTGIFTKENFTTPYASCTGQTSFENNFQSQLRGAELIMNTNAPNDYGKIKLHKQ